MPLRAKKPLTKEGYLRLLDVEIERLKGERSRALLELKLAVQRYEREGYIRRRKPNLNGIPTLGESVVAFLREEGVI